MKRLRGWIRKRFRTLDFILIFVVGRMGRKIAKCLVDWKFIVNFVAEK